MVSPAAFGILEKTSFSFFSWHIDTTEYSSILLLYRENIADCTCIARHNIFSFNLLLSAISLKCLSLTKQSLSCNVCKSPLLSLLTLLQHLFRSFLMAASKEFNPLKIDFLIPRYL